VGYLFVLTLKAKHSPADWNRMVINILIIIIISGLLGYIIYLQIQLLKKNLFIESVIKRLSGIEHSTSIDEMIAYLQNIKKDSRNRFFLKRQFLDDSSINFILEENRNLKIYMHYTKEENVALSILKDGFKFASSLYKTALPVSKDKLDMTIKHNSRKLFGEYIIIICISKEIVDFYSMELKKASLKNYSFENLLTETPPLQNEDSELIYLLAPQFIKGYIFRPSGEIIKNPSFDPYYNSPVFMRNIELLKNLNNI
jgi:hypothetical protein